MTETRRSTKSVLAVLERAAPEAIRGLQTGLDLPRGAAAEIYGATAALLAAGLARLTRRRPNDSRAAIEAVKKHGRPADVDAPDVGIAGRLDKERLSVRIGGILGEAGPRAAVWLADRTGTDADVVERAVAATAPIALGAFETALEPRALGTWVAMLPDGALTRPELLLDANEEPAEIFRRLRRHGQSRLGRLLGLSG
jgi:hypothetical protein